MEIRTEVLFAIWLLFAHDGSVYQRVVQNLILSMSVQTIVTFRARCDSAFMNRQTAFTRCWKISEYLIRSKNGSTVATLAMEVLTFLQAFADVVARI